MRTNVTMKPGMLVSLKTKIVGGISYERHDIDHDNNGTTDVSKWETTRVIPDIAAWEAAKVVRSAAGSRIRSACIPSEFGLLCLNAAEASLDRAIEYAQAIAADHNAQPGMPRVEIYVLRGRIATNDEEAMNAIASEFRGLISEMKFGIANFDVAAVRNAASQAKKLGGMLDEETGEKVAAAVKAARAAARVLVREVEDKSDPIVKEIAVQASGPLEAARIAFLDFEDPTPVEGDAAPAINVGRFSGVEVSDAV